MRPTMEFSQEEQREIVDNIWLLLQGTAASKKSAPDLQTKVNQALFHMYVITGNLPNIVQDLTTEISFAELLRTKATKSMWGKLGLSSKKLTEDQSKSLINDLDQLVETVLKRRREDCFTTGLDFEEGIISKIRAKFPTTIKDYEEKFKITLHDNFKISLQIYTLQRLRHLITGLQDL